MLALRRPSAVEIDRLVGEARACAPTYPEVGATRTERLPAGYRHDRSERRLGQGDAVFERAVRGLRAWQAHTGAGAEVFPHGSRVEDGETVFLLIRVVGLWATLPCRVVYTDEGHDSFAFAYGTLPGHPEVGESAFEIRRRGSGDVFFRIVAFSRTVDPLARLAAPLARRIQTRVTKRYLSALDSGAVRGRS